MRADGHDRLTLRLDPYERIVIPLQTIISPIDTGGFICSVCIVTAPHQEKFDGQSRKTLQV
jgi:hypothetical protein